MAGIVPQHEYYGLPHVEAAALPPEAEFADLLRPVGIQAGLLQGNYDEED
jgi:hypothetical protein